MLRPGGILRVRDFIYSFEPDEADQVMAAWVAAGLAAGWHESDLAQHILTEYSTFTWLLEPMLEHAGFEIRERTFDPNQVQAAYTCIRTSRRPS